MIAESTIAQNRSISGTIYSTEDSIPIPGVSVIVKGTTIGAISNAQGAYSIDIPQGKDTLIYRSIGYEPKTVGINSRTFIDINLSPESYKVDEIVVTAMGIKKESKALGYASQSVKTEELTRGNQSSMLNALQGKMAGVDISASSGAPGASTRITIRGVNSLSRSNQPLFVIDGVPVNNAFSGSSSINGGVDFGNMMNDINPDDIQDINVLPGAAASSLYGSRAANGVIIITLKKGASNIDKKPEVTLSGSYTWSEPLKLINYQNDYGQGINGNAIPYENMSWGPQFDQVERIWGHEVDSSFRTKPYLGLANNVKDFFEQGMEYNTHVGISGGSDYASFYASYGRASADGIFPADADSYNRNSLSIRGTLSDNNKFNATISINYINKKGSAVPTGQGNSSVYNQVMQTPRDISLLELEDLDNPFNTIDNYYSLYTANPYFILTHNGNEYEENRVFGNIDLSYKLFKGTTINWRLGGDASFSDAESWNAIIAPEGNNEFSAIREPGSYGISTTKLITLNSDLFIKHNAKINQFEINSYVAGHIDTRDAESFAASGEGLILEGEYRFSNLLNVLPPSDPVVKKRLAGLSGSIDLSYRSILYLSATARNDWSSSLPLNNNNFFYPGTSLSFIFSEFFNTRSAFSYGKIRASWARVGNDAPIYAVYDVFTLAGHSDGYGFYTFPTLNQIHAYEKATSKGNAGLKPEISEEIELGTDLRFLKGRLTLDAAWYNRITEGLLWSVPLPSTSGSTSLMSNVGKIQNQGIEISINAVPVKKSNFNYNFTLNFSKNNNTLLELTNGLDKVNINGISVDGGQQINLVAKPGKPIGVFEARTAMRDDQNRIIVDNQGTPRYSDTLKEYGSSQYKYILGWHNVINYKNITMSFTFDYKKGGLMYSRTKEISTWAGTTPATLYNNRQPFVVPNSVYEIDQDESGDPIYAENNIPIDQVGLINYWSNGGEDLDQFFLIDKSYFKLREASVYYNLPNEWIKKVKIADARFGVTGRNLFLWTPKNQYYIDPEATTFGTELAADFGEYGATPGIRSWSISLKLNF